MSSMIEPRNLIFRCSVAIFSKETKIGGGGEVDVDKKDGGEGRGQRSLVPSYFVLLRARVLLPLLLFSLLLPLIL